jgi:hypothetical protein
LGLQSPQVTLPGKFLHGQLVEVAVLILLIGPLSVSNTLLYPPPDVAPVVVASKMVKRLVIYLSII